jgi:hypothetical protein
MLRFSCIPEDAIAVICNLYSGASTQIRVPAGCTEKIPVRRGVIQGDCISPTIFNLFIEPLLHWFDQGSSGYTPSCIKTKLASLGYAADLSLLNEKATDSQWQMEKVHRYSAWAGMDLNVPKCAHSALHHGSGAAKLAHRESLRLSPDGKHTHAVTWKGTPLPFLEADESYKYLGVHTALTLNPKDHVEKLLEKIDKRLEKIAESAAIGTDVATVINETVLPCLDNALAAAALSPADIRELQSKLNIAYKRALGISKYTSSAMLSHPREQFGFGINTLMHRYIKTTNRTISTILTDKGIPGQLARALMKRQLTQHGMCDESITSNQWRWLKSPWLRKCKILIDSDTDVRVSGIEGERDTILAALKSCRNMMDAARQSHLKHVRRLWALGIFDVAQITIPGSYKVYGVAAFKQSFPNSNADDEKAYAHVCEHLNRARVAPFRPHVAPDPATSVVVPTPPAPSIHLSLIQNYSVNSDTLRQNLCAHATACAHAAPVPSAATKNYTQNTSRCRRIHCPGTTGVA